MIDFAAIRYDDGRGLDHTDKITEPELPALVLGALSGRLHTLVGMARKAEQTPGRVFTAEALDDDGEVLATLTFTLGGAS